MEKKCLDIQTVYPKSRIFISLLLHTKLPHLNRSVKEFNDMILEMVHKNKRLNIIDNFALLSDSNGCYDDNYCRFDKVTHQTYRADVGRKGLRIFSSSIKRCVSAKSGNQTRERFSATGGNYRAAAGRPRRSDGSSLPTS